MNNGSTETMLLKEPPKTCGNCGKCVAIVGHCDDSNDRVDLYDQSCENWTPRTDDVEQRCQQLEQLARDALAVISMACSLTNGDPEMRCVNLNCKEAHKSLRSRLEALGVSVDA